MAEMDEVVANEKDRRVDAEGLMVIERDMRVEAEEFLRVERGERDAAEAAREEAAHQTEGLKARNSALVSRNTELERELQGEKAQRAQADGKLADVLTTLKATQTKLSEVRARTENLNTEAREAEKALAEERAPSQRHAAIQRQLVRERADAKKLEVEEREQRGA